MFRLRRRRVGDGVSLPSIAAHGPCRATNTPDVPTAPLRQRKSSKHDSVFTVTTARRAPHPAGPLQPDHRRGDDRRGGRPGERSRRPHLGDAEPSGRQASSRSGRAPTARATATSPRAAGLEGVSIHGCRIGMAQGLARPPGVEIPAIMQAGGWRSELMVSRYIARESTHRRARAPPGCYSASGNRPPASSGRRASAAHGCKVNDGAILAGDTGDQRASGPALHRPATASFCPSVVYPLPVTELARKTRSIRKRKDALPMR